MTSRTWYKSINIQGSDFFVTLMVDYTLDEQPQVLFQGYTGQHIPVSNCSLASFGMSVFSINQVNAPVN